MKRAVICGIYLFLGGVAWAENREAVAKHWMLAEKYLAQGWKSHAMEEARVVLRLDPSHAGALALTSSKAMQAPVARPTNKAPAPVDLTGEAEQAYRESRVSDARRFAGEVLASDPTNETANRILSDLDSEEYQQSPLGENNVLKDLYMQGIASWRRGEWEVAAGVFARALALEVSHEQIRSFHDRARRKADLIKAGRELASAKDSLALGKMEPARASLARVIALDPANIEAKNLQDSHGWGPLQAERQAKARKHFNRGVELYGEGKWAESAREWEAVVSLDAGDEEAKNLLRKARAKNASAKKESSKHVVALHAEALKLYQQGNAGQARKIYMAILEIEPDNAKAKSSLAFMTGGK